MKPSQNLQIAQIAEDHHGILIVDDLSGIVNHDQVQRLVGTQRIERVERGVARLRGAPVTELTALAAACRVTGGVASHRSAAYLDGLIAAPPGRPELTVGPKQSARRNAIIHRSSDLLQRDVHFVEGIRTTNPTRTLLDLGAVVPAKILEAALETALRERLTTFDRLATRFFEVARRGRRGCGAIRGLLEDRDPLLAAADSQLEIRLWNLLRDAGGPLPQRQFPVMVDGEQYYLDLAYPERMVFIEGDGFGVHAMRGAFETDRRRQNKLVLLGWKPLRYTWRQIVREPDRVVAEIVLAYEAAA